MVITNYNVEENNLNHKNSTTTNYKNNLISIFTILYTYPIFIFIEKN